jgi:hypothetical protein
VDNATEPHPLIERGAPPTETALVVVTRWLVFSTLALAVVSLFGFGVGLLQWYTFKGQLAEMRSSSAQTEKLISANDELAKAARLANETNREALHSIQRAFVSVTHYKRDVLEQNSKPHLVLSLVWENSGNTPTRSLEFNTACFLDAPALTKKFNFKDLCQKEGSLCSGETEFLGPHETVGGGACWVSSDTLSNIQKGTQHFYILGIARYRDIFADTKNHTTRSCTEVTTVRGDPSRGLSEISVALDPCQGSNNCSDDDCTNE